MSWRDNLHPASFRGAAFHTDDRTFVSGLALVNHEFPKRNTPFAEDMGKEQWRCPVRAYVIGKDYMAARDELKRALDQNGPGTYVDHWDGELRAIVETWSVSEFASEGGWAVFDITFVEPGGDAGPTVGIPGFALIGAAAKALSSTAIGSFARAFRG